MRLMATALDALLSLHLQKNRPALTLSSQSKCINSGGLKARITFCCAWDSPGKLPAPKPAARRLSHAPHLKPDQSPCPAQAPGLSCVGVMLSVQQDTSSTSWLCKISPHLQVLERLCQNAELQLRTSCRVHKAYTIHKARAEQDATARFKMPTQFCTHPSQDWSLVWSLCTAMHTLRELSAGCTESYCCAFVYPACLRRGVRLLT